MSQHTEKLEGLLYAQGMNLAEQHLERGRQTSEQIQRDSQEKLNQLLEGEELRFQLESEKLCRQIMQSSRIRLDTEMDRLRWALVQEVLAEVRARLEKLSENPDRYHAVLEQYLAEAAAVLPQGDLVAEVDPQDMEKLRPHWDGMVARAAPGRKVALASLAEHASGGVMVRTAEGRTRVNNTFEGRLARMQEEVLGTIMDKLFKQAGGAS